MKSPRKTKNNITFDPKSTKEVKEQPKKEQVNTKDKEKEAQFQRLEEYVNESGLALAFNIIFAELISKQILPENFFTYTSMRLKQIGKEIEGLKTKEEINIEKKEEEGEKEEQKEEVKEEQKEENNEENEKKLFEPNNNQEDKENKEDDNVLLTVQKDKKKTIRKK
jgi:hypothetical protein